MLIRVIGGLLVSLCVCVSYADDTIDYSNQLISQALVKELYNSQVWLSLLHVIHNKTYIEDQGFLLSAPNFSAKQELINSIQYLLNDNADINHRCRFPARDFWLRKQLNLPDVSYDHCVEFKEFLEKAPADQISLVYASENISQASSMMGHTLLKISGKNSQNFYVEHGVSFYTEVKGFNLPKIIYDSIIVGKKGYFALSPFYEKKDYYAHQEQRNVWIYDLNLDETSRRLIHWHLWELHQTQLRYFFDDYNCATFTQVILGLSNKPELSNFNGWQTPLDVVKHINQANLVNNTQMYPSSRARVRMLTEEESVQDKWNIKQTINHKKELKLTDNNVNSFIKIKATQAYIDYLFEKQEVDQNKWTEEKKNLELLQKKLNDTYQIDLSDYKNPLLAANDSQFSLGLIHLQDKDYLKFDILPAAHYLIDDNRQLMSENELRLLNLSLLLDIERRKLKIDKFTVYSMASYLPFDLLTGGYSTKFNISYEPTYNKNLDYASRFNLGGGLGLTLQLAKDISFYNMLNIGIFYDDKSENLYIAPETGMIINEIYDMKTIINVTARYHHLSQEANLYKMNIEHAVPLHDQQRLIFAMESVWAKQINKPKQQFSLMWKKLW